MNGYPYKLQQGSYSFEIMSGTGKKVAITYGAVEGLGNDIQDQYTPS